MDRINKESQTYFLTTCMLNVTEIYTTCTAYFPRQRAMLLPCFLDPDLDELHGIVYFSSSGISKDQICGAKLSGTS